MVAQQDVAAHLPPSRQFNAHRAASEAAAEVRYDIIDDGIRSQSRLECLQSISNLKRCSPYWYPLPIHPLMVECPRCLRFTPSSYFEGGWCADCRSNAHHDNRLSWLWFESEHRYADWWQIGLRWYSTRPRLFPNVFRFEDEWEEPEAPEIAPEIHPFTEACAALKAMNADLVEPDDEQPDESLIADLLAAYERALKPRFKANNGEM